MVKKYIGIYRVFWWRLCQFEAFKNGPSFLFMPSIKTVSLLENIAGNIDKSNGL